MEFEEPEGILLIDKPAGPTSFDIVRKVRNALALKKAGHLGTLDPAATGLLAVCVNGATKIAPFMVGLDKEYRGTLVLGVETDTQDADGKVVAECDSASVTPEQIESVFAEFRGSLLQRPPAYSAVKINGVPLYKMARAGKIVQAPVRNIEVKQLDIEKMELPRVTFRALVSSGTYIRTLAHDIGKKLGVGAHLASLRRLKIGPFSVEDAIPLDELSAGSGKRKAYGAIISLVNALIGWPEILLDEQAASRVMHGSGLTRLDFDSGQARITGPECEAAKALDNEGRLIAIMQRTGADAQTGDVADNIVIFKPLRVWGR